jgi:hypothetical protein
MSQVAGLEYLCRAALISERVVNGYAGVYDLGGRPGVNADRLAVVAYPWGMLGHHRDDRPATVFTWWGCDDWLLGCSSRIDLLAGEFEGLCVQTDFQERA